MACARLSIAMPEEGIVAVGKSLMHSDSRRFLNVQAAPLPSEILPETSVPVEGNSSLSYAIPAQKEQQEQHQRDGKDMPVHQEPPPSEWIRCWFCEGFCKGQTLISTSGNVSVTMDEPPPTASEIGPTPTATKVSPLAAHQQAAAMDLIVPPSQPRRRRAAAVADNDPLASLFGTASTATTQQHISEPSKDARSSTQQAMSEEAPRPTPATPRAPSRLKRAATGNKPRQSEEFRSIFGTSNDPGVSLQARSNTSDMPIESTQERFSKRFRRELEEQDRISDSQARGDHDALISPGGENGTQSKRRLDEEQETGGGAEERPSKRREAEHGVDPEGVATTPLGSERRTRQEEQAVQPSIVRDAALPSSTSVHGEDTGQDSRFLQAIATNRKTKRPLDNFDKEFNQLRIARPPGAGSSHLSQTAPPAEPSKGKRAASQKLTDRPQAASVNGYYVDVDEVDDPDYRVWQQMDADDFDIHAAGNFVQVDFVPLVRKTFGPQRSSFHPSSATSIGDGAQDSLRSSATWQGRPNFKKFKVKERAGKMPVVMDLEETADFGTGTGYGKGKGKERPRITVRRPVDDGEGNRGVKEQGSRQGSEEVELMGPPPKAGPTQKRSVLADFSDEEDEEMEIGKGAKRKGRKQSAAPPPSKVSSSRGLKIRETEEGEAEEEDHFVPDMTLDLDEDITFGDGPTQAVARQSQSKRGSRGQQRGGSKRVATTDGARKRPGPLQSDDEDQDSIEISDSDESRPDLKRIRRR